MKKIILYNPSITTINIGDEIIFESICKHIQPILKDAFNIHVSTHLPVSYLFSKILSSADEKFVCGTNLLRNNLGGVFRQWDINIFNAKKLGPAVLIGVGWQQDNKRLNLYTKGLYKKILHKEKIHSVRDEYTKKRLESLGFTNVINTGCATMWDLTKDKCEKIPTTKSKKVIFTLTDYNKDPVKDKMIIDVLSHEYEEVYLWLQGYGDYTYAKDLGILNNVTIVQPNLESYDKILLNEDVDYIGTRLHGGVRALQNDKRTMIIAVDSRAEEKKKDFNLPVATRNVLTKDDVTNIIYNERKTQIDIPVDNIQAWKKAHRLI